MSHHSQPHHRRKYLRAAVFCLALAVAGVTAMALAASTAASFPDAKTLLDARQDDANWILPAKTYSGNRYTALTQIDKTNVGALGRAWRTAMVFSSWMRAPASCSGRLRTTRPTSCCLR